MGKQSPRISSFEVVNDSRHQKRFRNVSIFSRARFSPLSLFFFFLSSSFTSLHSSLQQLANFARPVQTRRPADLSQANLLFIHPVFLFFSPLPSASSFSHFVVLFPLTTSAPGLSFFFLFFDRRSVHRSLLTSTFSLRR